MSNTPSDAEIWELIPDEWTMTVMHAPGAKALVLCNVEEFARAIEAEVRKQDTELIQQMRVALTNIVELYNTDEGCRNLLAYKTAIKAITAARKRLENT